MNDKLWKVIQIASITIAIAGGLTVVFLTPKEVLPDGSKHMLFPSVTFQVIFVISLLVLLFVFVFSTMVRREKEVSLNTLKSTVIYLVGFAIFYLFLRSFRD
ncbi:hypothetical protein [Gracilibacillus dipsosauri]|uniref:hypothetical protein n=1 Tax=Gracilibacillus dipsosauri TaxID=178340 RepID=UPI00240A47E1